MLETVADLTRMGLPRWWEHFWLLDPNLRRDVMAELAFYDCSAMHDLMMIRRYTSGQPQKRAVWMLKRNKTLGKEDGVKYLGDISWLRDSNTSYIVDRMYMNKSCQVITWNGPCVTVYILASLHTHLKRPCIYLPSASSFFNMTVIETNPTSPIIVWLNNSIFLILIVWVLNFRRPL